MSGAELIVHGHFYQPPRENPWTEEVDRERSAAPFHDWNARISNECYRPNALARVYNDEAKIVAIVDNFSNMSYNVGPTLMIWLAIHEPDTYKRIVAADASGGGAIAQAFGHMILPLATDEDIRAQVKWGLTDFRYRFGRESQGMWLPECAVNDRVLAIMAEEGVRFTVLAPAQVWQVRWFEGNRDWVDVQPSWFDPGKPYRWLHPDDSSKFVDIVFYNGSLSHMVAFELSELSSQAFVDRVASAASGRDGMVTIATDGESFGHHHRYGARTLAYALEFETAHRNIACTNLNSAVARFKPTHEVRVRESAWSCAHGIGRWKQDCGCSTGGQLGWNQQWRTPLRTALDLLRDHVNELFDELGPTHLANPHEALHEYVTVLIGANTKEDFARTHVVGDPVIAFSLLELRRNAMAMYTSCGWFFNDISGLETIQILRYAARVFDLLDELGLSAPTERFIEVLSSARSNLSEFGSGADIWHKHVLSARVTPERVVKHGALNEILCEKSLRAIGQYEVSFYGRTVEQRGNIKLATGVASVVHRRTGLTRHYAYAAAGLGGLEVNGALVRVDDSKDETLLENVRTQFANGSSISSLLRSVSQLGAIEFDLDSALPEDAQRIMQETANALADRYSASYAQLYEDHRATLEDLTCHGYELPAVLKAPAELALARRFSQAVRGAESSTDPTAYELAVGVARQARAAGLDVIDPATTSIMQRLANDLILRAVDDPSESKVKLALDAMGIVQDMRAPVNLDTAQEAIYFALREGHSGALSKLAQRLKIVPESVREFHSR